MWPKSTFPLIVPSQPEKPQDLFHSHRNAKYVCLSVWVECRIQPASSWKTRIVFSACYWKSWQKLLLYMDMKPKLVVWISNMLIGIMHSIKVVAALCLGVCVYSRAQHNIYASGSQTYLASGSLNPHGSLSCYWGLAESDDIMQKVARINYIIFIINYMLFLKISIHRNLCLLMAISPLFAQVFTSARIAP